MQKFVNLEIFISVLLTDGTETLKKVRKVRSTDWVLLTPIQVYFYLQQ